MSLISKENIQKYLPQYPPFLMVDTLEFYEENKAISTFLILESNVLVENSLFSDAGLLENMAQTCALHAGYKFMNATSTNNENSSTGKQAPVGFIGSIKDYVATQAISVGDTISTHIIVEHSIGNASVVRGNVYLSDALVASCEMKIFLAV